MDGASVVWFATADGGKEEKKKPEAAVCANEDAEVEVEAGEELVDSGAE